MKKISLWALTILTLPLTFLGFTSPAFSQVVFQNANTRCEEELILCDSSSDPANCTSDIFSLSCKNLVAPADFNGDGRIDCAGSNISNFVTTPGLDGLVVSTLINNGGNTCGNQFDSAIDYAFGGLPLGAQPASLVVGRLNNVGNTDISVPDAVSFKYFSTAFDIPATPASDESTLPTTDSNWEPAGSTQASRPSNSADRNSALFDCDGDGDLDGALAVRDSGTDFVMLNILRNNGTGLQDIDVLPGGSFNTNIIFSEGPAASVAVADFDNLSGLDVALAINSDTSFLPASPENSIVVCLNNGTCDFSNCLAALNLDTQHVGFFTEPFSIAAGDFNNDGRADVVVSEPGLPAVSRGVHYYFGNGDGTFAIPGTHIDYNTTGDGDPVTLTTGFFNNDPIRDAAVNLNAPGTGGSGTIGVFTFNTTTNSFDTTDLSYGPNLVVNQGGLDAADFDQQGCDDIMAVATDFTDQLRRKAYIFLNGPQSLVANAGPDQTVALNTPFTLTGTSCTVTPVDPTTVVTSTWTVAPAAGVTLTDPTTLTPTFTATQAGTYTLTLTCDTQCTLPATDTMIITVPGVPPVPPVPPVAIFTQGGCVGSLVPGQGQTGLYESLWLLGPLTFFVLRKKRKIKNAKLFTLGIFIVILFASSQSFALTTSFSTNFFKPAFDDSEYFTVYSSPNMKKGHYHLGLWLDYANHPYEVGLGNFNRVSGITNNLLSANILGSYAFFDWMEVGGRLPVYLWNGINAPLLARPSESNINLGDFELDLKFRLLDREKHHVGVSILPYVIVPTATKAFRDFAGNGSVAGGAKVIVDGRIKDRASVSLNVGYEARDGIVDVGGNEINDHLTLGAGFSVDVIKKRLKVIGETQLETVVTNFFNRRTTPAEARLGFRYSFKNGIDANMGGGLGYTNGISSPDFRIFAGLTYTKRPIAKVELKEPPFDEVEIGEELTLADKIYFEFDKAVIRNISKPTLDKVAAFIKAHPEIKTLRVEGNTCDLGTAAYNQRLSERRAKAVVNYLVSQGLDPNMFHAVGYGESKPLVPNSDEAHREQNRRVQIFVEAKK